jgi:hypothetical protein
MEEEFYASIKLISGEEIFSKVCPCEEEDRILLILDTPIILETVYIRQLGSTSIRVHPWLKYSSDSMFIIDMDKVLTITEVSDEDLIKIHTRFIKEKFRRSKKSVPSSNMGYISSISEARISLEKLYKSN